MKGIKIKFILLCCFILAATVWIVPSKTKASSTNEISFDGASLKLEMLDDFTGTIDGSKKYTYEAGKGLTASFDYTGSQIWCSSQYITTDAVNSSSDKSMKDVDYFVVRFTKTGDGDAYFIYQPTGNIQGWYRTSLETGSDLEPWILVDLEGNSKYMTAANGGAKDINARSMVKLSGDFDGYLIVPASRLQNVEGELWTGDDYIIKHGFGYQALSSGSISIAAVYTAKRPEAIKMAGNNVYINNIDNFAGFKDSANKFEYTEGKGISASFNYTDESIWCSTQSITTDTVNSSSTASMKEVKYFGVRFKKTGDGDAYFIYQPTGNIQGWYRTSLETGSGLEPYMLVDLEGNVTYMTAANGGAKDINARSMVKLSGDFDGYLIVPASRLQNVEGELWTGDDYIIKHGFGYQALSDSTITINQVFTIGNKLITSNMLKGGDMNQLDPAWKQSGVQDDEVTVNIIDYMGGYNNPDGGALLVKCEKASDNIYKIYQDMPADFFENDIYIFSVYARSFLANETSAQNKAGAYLFCEILDADGNIIGGNKGDIASLEGVISNGIIDWTYYELNCDLTHLDMAKTIRVGVALDNAACEIALDDFMLHQQGIMLVDYTAAGSQIESSAAETDNPVIYGDVAKENAQTSVNDKPLTLPPQQTADMNIWAYILMTIFLAAIIACMLIIKRAKKSGIHILSFFLILTIFTITSADAYAAPISNVNISEETMKLSENQGKTTAQEEWTVDITPDLQAGDIFYIIVNVFNKSDADKESFNITAVPGDNVALLTRAEAQVPAVPAGKYGSAKFKALALGGGSEPFKILCDSEIIYSSEIIIGGPGYYAGDNHTHSTFSDDPFVNTGILHGAMGEHPVSMAEHAEISRSLGLDWIYTTDHNSVQGAKAEKDRINQLYNGTFVNLVGSENTVWWSINDGKNSGHFNAYGSEKLYANADYPSKTHTQLVEEIIADGGYAYCNHPFSVPYDTRLYDLMTTYNFRGYEIVNAAPGGYNLKAVEYWDAMNSTGKGKYFGMSNSDSHYSQITGNVYNKGYLPSLTAENIDALLGETGAFYATNGIDLKFELGGAGMGETLNINKEGTALCRIAAHTYVGLLTDVTLYRIKVTGDLMGIYTKEAVYTVDLTDENTNILDITLNVPVADGWLYRLEVNGTKSSMVSTHKSYAYGNPIWVKSAQENGCTEITRISYADGGFVKGSFRYDYLVCNSKFDPSRLSISVCDGATSSIEYIAGNSDKAGVLNVTVTAQNGNTRIYTYYIAE